MTGEDASLEASLENVITATAVLECLVEDMEARGRRRYRMSLQKKGLDFGI